MENVQIAAGKSDYFSVSEQFVAKSAFVVLVKVKLVRFVFYSFFLELHNSTRYSMINFLGTFNEGFEVTSRVIKLIKACWFVTGFRAISQLSRTIIEGKK